MQEARTWQIKQTRTSIVRNYRDCNVGANVSFLELTTKFATISTATSLALMTRSISFSHEVSKVAFVEETETRIRKTLFTQKNSMNNGTIFEVRSGVQDLRACGRGLIAGSGVLYPTDASAILERVRRRKHRCCADYVGCAAYRRAS